MDDAFEERRKKNEDKWALDEALKFKALARRNKLLGLWAAAELGLTAAAAAAYAQTVVAADLRPGGAVAKVTADLAALGPGEAVIRHKLEELARLAREQVQAGI